VLNLSALVRTLALTIVPFTEGDWSEAVMVYHSRRRSLGPGAARFGECLTAAVAARTGAAVVSEPE
jgi:predicted nucleic acid-binding protein